MHCEAGAAVRVSVKVINSIFSEITIQNAGLGLLYK